MEFYLDRLYNYQAVGGQNWNVDFGRLPASAQEGALAAIRAPGTPQNLVLLANLQSQYPSAFERVSGLSTLPAPDLSQSVNGPFPFGATIELILAYYNQEVIDSANDMSAKSKLNAVVLNHREMELADDANKESKAAATAALVGGAMGGVIGVAGGATSFGFGFKGATDAKAHSVDMRKQTTDKLETQKYQETMERNVKQLQDGAQANRADAQRLNGYADEINTPEGMSPASRQKLNDEIAEKDAQLQEVKDQRASYVDAKKRAFEKSQDESLSVAERTKAQEEFESIKAGEKRFMDDLDAREKHLKADRDALTNLEKMDANVEQLKADTQRLKDLEEKDAPTVADAKEMLQLRKENLPRRTEALVKERAKVQVRIDELKSEATRMDDMAKSLQKAAHKELESRQIVQGQQEKDLNQAIETSGNETRAGSAGAQAVTAMTPLATAPGTYESQMHESEKEHIQAEKGFLNQSGDVDRSFGNEMTEMAKAAMDFWKEMQDYYNQYLKTVAGNV